MKKLIVDCDNTFDVPGCDVDDGLALLYALGCRRAEVLGVTASFGNSDVETTYAATKRLLGRLGCPEIPVWRGCAAPGVENAPAVGFLLEMAQKYEGELCILATGGLTNLAAAAKADKSFFTKIQEIALMGGVTKPLYIQGKQMAELNFACDAKAALAVLRSGAELSIATANHCLDVLFSTEEVKRRIVGPYGLRAWLHGHIAAWFDLMQRQYGGGGTYKWDVLAAAQLLEPEWFYDAAGDISPSLQSLQSGGLLGEGPPLRVRLPRVKNPEAFKEHVYSCYEAVLAAAEPGRMTG